MQGLEMSRKQETRNGNPYNSFTTGSERTFVDAPYNYSKPEPKPFTYAQDSNSYPRNAPYDAYAKERGQQGNKLF